VNWINLAQDMDQWQIVVNILYEIGSQFVNWISLAQDMVLWLNTALNLRVL
jgi:hypothetical protein